MRTEKHFLVKQIGEMISSSDYVYFVTFAGMTVEQLSDVRNQLYPQNATMTILKNALIRKAGALIEVDSLANVALAESTAMVYGTGDASAVAKILQEYSKKNTKLSAKAGFMEGVMLSADDVDHLASLPPKAVMQAMLLGVLQAPSRNLVSVLNAKAASILNVLNAYKDKIEQ